MTHAIQESDYDNASNSELSHSLVQALHERFFNSAETVAPSTTDLMCLAQVHATLALRDTLININSKEE